MALPQPVITRQMVLAELIKAGIRQDIADDLSYRYYKNELTHKDIDYLKENFDIKLGKVQDNLNNKIDNVKTELKADIKELDNKIDNVKTELKSDIEKVESNLKFEIEKVETSLRAEIKASHTELDNKIDNVENNLNNKIDKVRTELKADISSVSSEVALVRKDIEMNKLEINSQLVNITSKLESSSKLNCWMFGTVITLFIGVLLTLIPIVYSLLKK